MNSELREILADHVRMLQERIAALLASIDTDEAEIGELKARRFKLKRRMYSIVAAVVADSGESGAAFAMRTIAAEHGYGDADLAEMLDLVAAIEQGMRIHEYTELGSAKAWLQWQAQENGGADGTGGK